MAPLRAKIIISFILLIVLLMLPDEATSQRRRRGMITSNTAQTDSLNGNDSLRADTVVVRVDSVAPTKKQPLDAPVIYESNDSTTFTLGGAATLYGSGKVNYQNIELAAEVISMNLDSSTVHAYGIKDTTGTIKGKPVFKEGETAYDTETISYNFKSKKAGITDIITQQGEGYVTGSRAKKGANDEIFMEHGRYTTCDHHDHPHFYMQLTRAKVRPKKNVVTGPAYLVVEDVPLPLAVPFFFFPFSSSYSSGFIMPTYMDDSSRGFGLAEGGYYFAMSDIMDLKLTGDIFTKGSWRLSGLTNYNKRYKYSGTLQADYQVTKTGDKGMPDYTVAKDFKVVWNHRQDAKASPNSTFSASVNFSTSSYERSNINNLYNSQLLTQNTKTSSISYSRSFPDIGLTLSGTTNIAQTMRDSSIAVTLPSMTVTMSRIFPFKRKHPVGKERWYEKISMSYSGTFSNSITTKENLLFKSNLIKDWQNAMQHSIPVSATFSVLKYLNISPSFNYKERWYTSKIEQEYDTQKQALVARDTTYGFYRIYDFNASISASTTLYGFYKPLPFLGNKVEMIRHRFEPSITVSAQPDFASSRFGFYETYVYQDANGEDREYTYSPFAHNMYGVPGTGKQGNISFDVNNNIEMKVRSDKDSTGFKKISLIDKLSLGMSYNMAADSFKWSDLSVGLRLKLSKSYTLNLNGQFDTYTYDENGHRVDIPRWKAGKGIGRLRGTSTSFSYTFNNDTFKKLFGGGDSSSDKSGNQSASTDPNADPDGLNPDGEGEGENKESGGRLLGKKKETGETDADGYLISKIPWSLSFSYGLSLRYGDFNRSKLEYDYALTHSLSFNGNIQPTKNWRFNFNATYDFDAKKISYMTCNVTRNLHCWQMTASFVPVGPYKSYTFSIAVSSALLKDLKYDKRSNYRDGQQWY